MTLKTSLVQQPITKQHVKDLLTPAEGVEVQAQGKHRMNEAKAARLSNRLANDPNYTAAKPPEKAQSQDTGRYFRIDQSNSDSNPTVDGFGE